MRQRSPIIAILYLLLSANRALPCECAFIASPKAARGRAHVVWVGTVTKIVIGDVEVPKVFDKRAQGRGPASVRFRILYGWKGPEAQEAAVSTERDSCGAPFEVGQTYLVFSTRVRGQLTTSICAGNRWVEPAEIEAPAAELVKELGPPTFSVKRVP